MLAGRLCHCALMKPHNKRAGGCFLMGAILLGFLAGLAARDPLLGVWTGLAAGIIIAVALWLIDRRRG